ncbi:MAG: isocitrate lyase/phosphoenolpyruvate mutase family protein [Alphaproteobacteria bacterium]|nr:isocitrate lyase/phosphoenolpyruvate mutase family protein [Alphaproteobacteria bacterium]
MAGATAAFPRDEALADAATVVGATNLPVSADLKNGFGDEPEYVAEIIRIAADAGLVGCTIENAMKDKDNPIYPFEAPVARIEATAAAADAFGFAFHLTGRCELLAGGMRIWTIQSAD